MVISFIIRHENRRRDAADGWKSAELDGAWSSGGDQLAYIHANARQRYGFMGDESRRPKIGSLADKLEGGGWEPLDWSQMTSKILLAEGLSINESYLWLVDTKTREDSIHWPQRTEKNFLRRRSFQQRRKRHLRHDGQGFRISPARVCESLNQRAQVPDIDIPWDVEGFDLLVTASESRLSPTKAGLSVLARTRYGRKGRRAQIGNSHWRQLARFAGMQMGATSDFR